MPADTLSQVSNAGVNKVLNKRRRTGHTQPARQRSAIAPSVCGAPALLDQDDQTTIQEEEEQEDKLPPHDEDDGMEWESEDDDDNRFPSPLPHLNRSTIITVDATTVDDEGKPSSSSKRKPRITYTKEDKDLARLIHRSHLLCLLGRAMLYDTAADDPTLQALMVSLVPSKILQTLPVSSSSGNNSGSDSYNKKKKIREQWMVEDAERIVKWFSSEFKLSPHTSQQQLAVDTIVARNNSNNDGDQIAAALKLAEKGVESITEQLIKGAKMKKGGGEELVALFVAMMRGLGGLARSTRVVEPSSLRPGDVVKQEEHAVKRFQSRKQQQQRGYMGGNEAVIDLTGEEEEEKEEEMTVGEIAKMLLTKAAGSSRRRKTNASNNSNNNSKGAEIVDAAVKEEEEEEEEGDDKTTDNNNKKKKKSKGDLELEQQLAIAMAATAFQQPQQDGDEDEDDDTKNNKKKTTHPSSKPKTQIGRSKSASWSTSLSQDIGTFWCELFIGSLTTGKWVHVDPLTCLINKEQQVEGLRARGSALPYVISLMGGGNNVKDVTKRYVSSYIQSQKDRDDEWWSETLQPLRRVPVELLSSSLAMEAFDVGEKKKERNNDKNKKDKQSSIASEITFTTPPNTNNTTISINQLAKLLTEREDAELHELELREKMSKPSTISAFKNHPTYVLKRHISKYQCVKPGSTFCGCHNGEMYYNKKDITELHTIQKWRQLGREVVENEVNKPAKIVKKRGAAAMMVNNNKHSSSSSSNSSRKKAKSIDVDRDDNEEQADGNDEGDGEVVMTQLYGDWQTRELILKGAENGKVPRNERGNVEVPPFAHAMPPGCVHLNLPSIAGICRKLTKEMENDTIDYAPALVGFDYRRGGAVPKIEGVVVCEEVHQMVLERYWEDRKDREETDRKKREKEEEEARSMMRKTLEARARLEAGVGNGNGSTSMAEAAMMLVEEQQEEAVPSGPRGRKMKQKEVAKRDGEPIDLDIEEI